MLKKVVMKLLDEIHNGEEPKLQWVRVVGSAGADHHAAYRPCKKGREGGGHQALGEWEISSRCGLGSLCSGLLQIGASSEEMVRLVGRMVERVDVS